MDDKSRFRETVERWRRIGPAEWAREVLGAEPTDQQLEGGRALVERRKVSIRSGHGTGKSAFMAWCVLWFMVCYAPCKVPATAPTAHQLSDILWSELALWFRRLGERAPTLAAAYEWKADGFEAKEAPREAFAVTRTSRKEQPEALQGFHALNMLFLIDEASGIPNEVFEVAEGALSTKGAFVVMAANPTRMEGYFYDSHHKMRESWAALHWDGEKSPLVSREYIDGMARNYGVESAVYRIRVNGDFAGNPDGVIPMDWIESAVGRDVQPFGPIVWGVDVARFGADRTALAKRRGNVLLDKVQAWRGKDTMQTAGMLKEAFDRLPGAERPTAVYVDVIGLGAGVVDRCQELGLPVVGVNVAESPAIADQFMRLRDELWFKCRDWFAARDVCIPDDQALIAELSLPNYRVESSGKKKVQSKEELKKLGVTSPDLADALVLTFAQGGAQRRTPLKYPAMGYA